MLAWIQTIVNEGLATHHQHSTRNRQRMKYTFALTSSRFINKLSGQYYYVQSKDWPLEKPFQENAARQCQRKLWSE